MQAVYDITVGMRPLNVMIVAVAVVAFIAMHTMVAYVVQNTVGQRTTPLFETDAEKDVRQKCGATRNVISGCMSAVILFTFFVIFRPVSLEYSVHTVDKKSGIVKTDRLSVPLPKKKGWIS